ncbi:SHD1 domain-containing protein [Rhodopirellula sp. JC639]|uniref:SHD1 domain-containing protein n=1 Tax=Stieleria mannarensis TaxID=2755585 RepID=UPI0015FEF31F|nr:SHD1 domain-containing protein [Rhodopirellula sp. JC639]
MTLTTIRLLLIGGIAFVFGANAKAEPLRYRIAPDEVVAYTVTITADTPASVDTMKGIIAFSGKRIEGETMTVEYSGGLSKAVKTKSSGGGPRRGGFGPRRGGPPIPRGPFDRPDFRGLTQSTSTLVLTTTGGVESMRGDSQLPFLLGNLSLLPFDALPGQETKQWQDGSGLTITSRSSNNSRFGPRFGPFANDNDESVKTGGGETASYQIQREDGDLVTIGKSYSLASPAANSKETGFEMTGNGTWVFHRELGVTESMDFKADLAIQSENTEVKIPVTVAFERMPEEEYAAHVKARQDRIAELQKQSAERRARQAAAAKEREGKPLTEQVKREVMADLNSSQWPTIANRLRRMKGYKPHPDDFDIAMRVKELQSHKVIGVSMAAKNLWKGIEPVIDSANQPASPTDTSNPFATSEEKMEDARGMRQWSDNTGSFQIEAQFVHVDGATVVLKRADGKELRVPIARLSTADQAVVKSLASE